MAPSPKSFFTFPRFVAVIACSFFALVGSWFFLTMMFGRSITPPPQPANARADLERDGVSTRVEPLFEIDTSNAPIAVDGRLSHTVLPSGQKRGVAAAIGVETSVGEANRQRTPIDLALVFDVSGSMEGAPLSNVQLAAEGLLHRLGERDRVSIVAYSSEAWVVAPLTPVTDSRRHVLIGEIRGLMADGGTNISGGWETGLTQLSPDAADRVRRIVLLSDGQANEGITDIGELGSIASRAMENGVSTTAMGVGLDYNEDLMQQMARSGGGNYYFVAGSNPTAAFDDELEKLTGTVSSRTRLRVSATPNVPVVAVEGYDWRPTPDGVEIELGSMAHGMRRDALIEFAEHAFDGPFNVKAQLIWSDGSTRDSHTSTWQQGANTGEERVDVDVLSRLQKVRTARALTDATMAYQRGDRDSSAAMLDRMASSNEAFVDDYDVDADVFARANDRLRKLASDIRAYDPSSNRGKFMIKGSKFNSANVAVDSSVTF